jgi:hypothetical protein
MADRKESAADITISVGEETEVVVEEFSLTKEIDIESIYGSGRVYPDGYSINEVSYQGSMELQGNRLDLESALFNENGIPEEFTITVTHMNGETTKVYECLCTSDGYEMSAGDTTTTTFEFMAHRKEYSGGVEDREP